MPAHPHTTHRTRFRAFTLTELLVVIAIIVLLIGLLLAALGQVQKKSRETATLATMQSFSNACESFFQEHGSYPGVVPEAILANDPKITSTENALMHLIGGVVRAEDYPQNEYDELKITDGWKEVTFEKPSGGNYRIKFNRGRFGEGPIINRKPYAPYFTPGNRDFGAVEHAGPEGEEDDYLKLPDLLDAWGQPILYLRRQRTVGPLVGDASDNPQFNPASLDQYLNSESLGRLGRDQTTQSILNDGVTTDQAMTFARIIEHPAILGQARGAFMLLSAGADGIYFAKTDGPGAPDPDDWVVDIFEDEYPASIIEEYDDVLSFGGS